MKKHILIIAVVCAIIGTGSIVSVLDRTVIKASRQIQTGKIDTYTGNPGDIHFDGNALIGLAPATTDSGAVILSQLDSLRADTISIHNYISGASGELAYFATDTTIRAINNGTEGQILKIVSGVPTWVTP